MRGATPDARVHQGQLHGISIHAPREGCDPTPVRSHASFTPFQSTHPVRGATPHLLQISCHAGISIHAPREGCDRRRFRRLILGYEFQSTHPVRGATCPASLPWIITRAEFQSTHPVRGATIPLSVLLCGHLISIHAPREGCDTRSASTKASLPPFQSTHPVRGATLHVPSGIDVYQFQSTHPVRGATVSRPARRVRQKGISIHAPREGCDLDGICAVDVRSLISIHAPREGCDNNRTGVKGVCWKFQSTHPVRGATVNCP